MYKLRIFLFLLPIATLHISAQNVSNVDFWQEGKKVNIVYNLDKTADVSVSISTDGGKTFSSPLKQVTGGGGKNVSPGKNTIVWDVLSEYDKLIGENICFRVSAAINYNDFDISDYTGIPKPNSGDNYTTPLRFTRMFVKQRSTNVSYCFAHIDTQAKKRSGYLIDFTTGTSSSNFRYNGDYTSRWYNIFEVSSSKIGTSKTYQFNEFTLIVTKTNIGLLFEYSVPMFIHSMQFNFKNTDCYLKE